MATETKVPRIGVSERNNPLAARAAEKPDSVIAAMHTRFELASYFDGLADDAIVGEIEFDHRHSGLLEDARHDLDREMDALRYAIMLQAPTDRYDAAIIAYHLHIVSSLIGEGMAVSDDDRAALCAASSALFDFMVGEGFASMETVGKRFTAAAMLCHERRQAREGELPGMEA